MASVESASPLKTWIRKHSPIKSKNKPLPARPSVDGSPRKPPSRAPGRAISGNASPTRPVPSDHGGHKVAKRKISALWKHNATDGQSSPTKSRHRRVVSSPVQQDGRPSSADSLSERVSALEAQLRAAKAELATASNTVKQVSPFKSRPAAGRRTQSFETHGNIDRSVEQRQRDLLRGNYYDGVVESLLQPDYATASRTAMSYSSRDRSSPERRSASAAGYYEKAMSDYRNLEEHYTEEGDDTQALEIARRRTELRAAEWKRMQAHLSNTKKQRIGSKRSHEQGDDADTERPVRRQKQDTKDKALPELPQRSGKRAISEGGCSQSHTHQPATDDLDSKAHVIQYVQVKSQAKRPAPSASAHIDGPESDEGDVQVDDGNVTVFCDDEDEEYAPPSPQRRHLASPSRLHTVDEEFEWNDEEIF